MKTKEDLDKLASELRHRYGIVHDDQILKTLLSEFSERGNALYHQDLKLDAFLEGWKRGQSLYENTRFDDDKSPLEIMQSKLSAMEKENAELKEIVKQGLPEDCKQSESWGREVKFCSIRQGDGNQCKHCLNF